MKSQISNLKSQIKLALLLAVLTFAPMTIYAAAPTTDVFSNNFKLIVCDGPQPPANTTPPPPADYKVCNFKTLMVQVQHILNVMVALGVLAAIVGFCYAGGLYVTGKEGNITKAVGIFKNTFWGFILMLTAWFIVYQILDWLAVSPAAKGLLIH